MRLYETTFITDSQLPEAEVESEIRKIEDLIKSGGGQIVETQRWGIKRFAYEIGKKRQGYYAHFLYKGTPTIPASVEAAFKVNERILRFLTVLSIVDLEKRDQEANASRPAVVPEVIVPTIRVEDVDEPDDV